MRKLVTSRRVKACGRNGARHDGSVVVRITDAIGTAAEEATGALGRVAGLSGLFRCAAVWLCPECSLRISAGRARELETVLGHYLSRGGWAVLVTLTMRHHAGDTLTNCLRAFSKGWSAVTAGKRWQADKAATDFAGYCRALEVTESPAHGWHVHAHAILVFNSRPSDEALDAMAHGMFRRWSAGLQRAGMPAPLEEYGLDVQTLPEHCTPAALAEASRGWAGYVAKGLCAEAVLGATKDAKNGNRTIRELMRAAIVPQRWEDPGSGTIVETLDETARARLAQYERAIKGRKQLTWSTGRHNLRLAAGLAEQEPTDEELAAVDLEGDDAALLPRESWQQVGESRVPSLLAAAERGGVDGVRRWLDERGIAWSRPTGLTRHLGGMDWRPRGGERGAGEGERRGSVRAGECVTEAR